MREYKAGRRRTKKEPSAKPPDDGRPQIFIVNGEMPRMIEEIESAIIANDYEIYQRGDWIVRPATMADLPGDAAARTPRIIRAGVNYLTCEFTRCAQWLGWDARSDGWVPKDAPKKIADTYLEMLGKWRVRRLLGVINAPTLRPDGSVLNRPGYDTATAVIFDPDGVTFPEIPPRPTRQHAITAVGEFQQLLGTMEFDSPVSFSVALSLILTALIRPSLVEAPLHAISAPTPGSGKSMIVDVAHSIAFGRRVSVMKQGTDENETEKTLAGCLLAGEPFVSIDNCDRMLGGDLIAQALSQSSLKIRPFGGLNIVNVNQRTLFAATGNNLLLGGDLARRTLLARLDPKCERPELREFRFDPLAVALANRGKYVAAALTILRAYHLAGRPAEGVVHLAGFGDWSRWVRGAILWLGLADPCDSMETARSADPVIQAATSVAQEWWTAFGDRRVTAADIIGVAAMKSSLTGDFSNPEFREALLAVVGDHGVINGMRLGRWLGKHKDRIYQGFSFRLAPERRGGTALWRLTKVGAP